MNAQPMVASSATAEAFFGAYNRHDVEQMIALCAHDAILRYVPMGKLGEGPVRTIGRRYWKTLIGALPDLAVSVQWLAADARGAAAEVLIADERRGFRLPHAFLLRFDENGRIGEIAAYWDNVDFAFQSMKALLGAIINAGMEMRGRPA